jgi:hypothetical protein
VVLTGRTLFAEGVAARLRQHEDRLELIVVDTWDDMAQRRVIEARPETLILDATDTDVSRRVSLTTVLQALPGLRVVRLDPERNQVQVVTSEQHPAQDIEALIDVIGLSNA